MPLFKKSKKSRTPSQHPASFGIPTQVAIGPLGFGADLDININSEGLNNGEGSRVSLLNRRVPGISNPALTGGSGVTEPESRRRAPSNGQNRVDVGRIATEFLVEGASQVQNQSGRGGQGIVSQPHPILPPEPIFGSNQDGEGTFQDWMERDEDLPTSKAGSFGASIGGAKCKNNLKSTVDASGTGEGETELAEIPEVTEREPQCIPFDVLSDKVPGRFSPLKVVLQAVSTYADREGLVAIGYKIKGLFPRIVALEDRFDLPPSDTAKEGRRNELLSEFGRIEGQLRTLVGKPELPSEDISGLLEDARDTIFCYQTALQEEIYSQQQEEISLTERTILDNFRCSKGAEYRHGNRNGCLKGTRVTVLDGIELWARDFNKSPVYWLNGLAGTGKTAVAQTIAERSFADGQLGASFFCSRDFEDRSNLNCIIPTLAVQLARKYPEFRSMFIPLVQRDPGIAHESLYNQMNALIVQPLRESGISTVIVIDALDECKDQEPASVILSVLGRFVSEIPKVKFFLTGRPEPRIRTGFRLPLLAKATDVFILHDVGPSLINSDILLFLRHNFLELADRRGGLDGWPTKENVDLLCERAAGLFVYAVATIRFINYKNTDPRRQLDLLLRSPESSAREGRTKLTAKTTLDSLYTSILQGALDEKDPENDHKARSVLGAVLLAINPLSPSAIATLLGLETADVFLQLSSIHSLLVFQENTDHPVRPFHKSFPDFITDPARCFNHRFHVSPHIHHQELLNGCLGLMNQTLERNMCKLPEAVTNAEVSDMQERITRHIEPALQYACTSWHKHLAGKCSPDDPTISRAIHCFLKEKFLFWLECLSVLGAVKEAINALEVAAKWLEASPILDLVNDCSRFAIAFFEVISVSAPHIYHSAISLCPRTSIIRELHGANNNPLVRFVHGVPISWDLDTVTVKRTHRIANTAWSPCSRFIAVVPHSPDRVEILDAMTLERFSTTSPIPQIGEAPGPLVFSPDGRSLTLYWDMPGHIITWDLQTGGLASDIEMKGDPGCCEEMKYSQCGIMLWVLFRSDEAYMIRTYDTLTGTAISSHSPKGQVVGIWTHGERLRFTTLEQAVITVWEAELTLRQPPTAVHSLSAPEDFDPSNGFGFLPTLSRLSFVLPRTVMVWDAQDSRFLLNTTVESERGLAMTFSPDGRFFAYQTPDGPTRSTICVWKESPTGYVLHQRLMPDARTIASPRFSHNGKFILLQCGNEAFQLWPTEVPSASLPNSPTGFPHSTNDFVLEFSPDEGLAVLARMESETITVLDLKLGYSRLTIDAGMAVYAARVVENIVYAVCAGKVFAWDMPRGLGVILNRTANASSSTRTTTFECQYQPRGALISPDSHYIIIVTDSARPFTWLDMYNTTTGEGLGTAGARESSMWLTPGGDEIWYSSFGDSAEGWKIVKDGGTGHATFDRLSPTENPPGGFPWRSTHGYQVTNDGWILCPNGRRLLLLPRRWRADELARRWSGHYFALLGHALSEPLVLDLQQE